MKKLIILLFMLFSLALPVNAMEFTAPSPPESAEALIPAERETFGEGLLEVLKAAMQKLDPALTEACGVCISLIAVMMLASVLRSITEKGAELCEFVAVLTVAGILFARSNSMIQLGAKTIEELSEYGKLLLPVMTSALAAQGGAATSSAVYIGTVAFDTILNEVISKLLIPLCYIFLVLAVANSATNEESLKKIKEIIKWLMSWSLKTILYVFTGYMGITGVVSGTTDAAALKVTKMTISGMVPVVGGILSDASESLIVSAGIMKNAAGIYGMLALIGIWISPFLEIGIHYLLLKGTGMVCEVFGVKRASELIQSFSAAMGLLLAMTGTVCVLLLISTVCFMRGIG